MSEQKDPEYLLGHVGPELERLRKQHIWIQTCLKGQIVFAPVDLQKKDLKVLDVGCADGTLLRDLQNQVSPTAELVGADIMPSFLPKENASGNISYVIQDICEPFASDLQSKFDLTAVRFVLAGSARVGLETAVTNLVSSLAPGGWLQVIELNSEVDTNSTPALKDFFDIMSKLFVKLGMGPNFAPTLDAHFKKAGLENVSIRTAELPAGKKLRNEIDLKNSIEPFKITIPSVIEACRNLGVELPSSVTDNLQERFEREMAEQGGVMTINIVTGQKKSA